LENSQRNIKNCTWGWKSHMICPQNFWGRRGILYACLLIVLPEDFRSSHSWRMTIYEDDILTWGMGTGAEKSVLDVMRMFFNSAKTIPGQAHHSTVSSPMGLETEWLYFSLT
jgi:hypothetical protein